jgi:hypothetical protein
MRAGHATSSGRTVAVRVPMTFRRIGGRKQIIAPGDTAPGVPRPQRRVDATIVKALGRAHRWKGMLENGEYTTTAELAAAEKINASYLARVLRLTLLAPDIVQSLLDGDPRIKEQLQGLLTPFPVGWDQQRRRLLNEEPLLRSR